MNNYSLTPSDETYCILIGVFILAYEIAAPSRMEYNTKSRNLTLESSYNQSEMSLLSLRVRQQGSDGAPVNTVQFPTLVLSGASTWWAVLKESDAVGGVGSVKASLCLQRRNDICSDEETANLGMTF